jgi:hypothetical protein
MRQGAALPPLGFCDGTRPSQAPHRASDLNCVESPTLATTAEALAAAAVWPSA